MSKLGNEFFNNSNIGVKSTDHIIGLESFRKSLEKNYYSEVSIGNYVLSGGELAAQVITDSITRLIPGVLGNPESLEDESHSSHMDKEYPHYTRPANFTTDEGEQWGVPDILLSGDHAKIDKWREDQAS